MTLQTAHYPIRTVSRSVAKRAARRVTWFVMGTGFGVGCALSLTNALTPSNLPISWDTAHQASNLSISFVEEELKYGLASKPATDGVHVTAVSLPNGTSTTLEMNTASRFATNLTESPSTTADRLKAEAVVYDTYPLNVDMKVGNGDTLMTILTDTGVSYQEAQKAVSSMGKLYNPKHLNVGQNVSLVLDKDNSDADAELVISSMILPVNALSKVKVVRDEENHFAAETIKTPVFPKIIHAGGRINSSLYQTAIDSGVPAGTLAELINAYSFDVDFQRDVHPGDHIDVMFEKMVTKEGRIVGSGKIVYAELEVGKRTLEIYSFTDSSGFSDYYNAKGESARKALLRTPISGARITSTYGMRHHPVLGYSKMHKGVDFGAARGTPIYAAGDGVVKRASRYGGYGNYLKIQHEGQYATAYAHIHKFAKSVKAGARVKQGQIVAYVGTTGRSTGPHLHYEVLKNGKQVNPSGVKFKTGKTLKGTELANFKKAKEKILATLKNTPAEGTSIAMAQ